MSKEKITLAPGMETDMQDTQAAQGGTVAPEDTQHPDNTQEAPQGTQEGGKKKVKDEDPGADGHYVHKLNPPFHYENATYTTLTFDFARLVGADMLDIETELQARQVYALTPEISRNFQCLLAAKASGVGDDVLQALPLRDFNKITAAARAYLLKAMGED